jgi:hypothetical protein
MVNDPGIILKDLLLPPSFHIEYQRLTRARDMKIDRKSTDPNRSLYIRSSILGSSKISLAAPAKHRMKPPRLEKK